MTFNGVSIYYVLQELARIRSCRRSRPTPIISSFRAACRSSSPMSRRPVNAMLFKHSKYPNAAKEYIRFMMEKAQYGPWLANCLGYWSEPLKAYSQDEVLERRSEAGAIRRRDGYAVLRRLQGADHRGVSRGGRPTTPWWTCSPRSSPAMPRRKPAAKLAARKRPNGTTRRPEVERGRAAGRRPLRDTDPEDGRNDRRQSTCTLDSTRQPDGWLTRLFD